MKQLILTTMNNVTISINELINCDLYEDGKEVMFPLKDGTVCVEYNRHYVIDRQWETMCGTDNEGHYEGFCIETIKYTDENGDIVRMGNVQEVIRAINSIKDKIEELWD